jgi:hypothetical protein
MTISFSVSSKSKHSKTMLAPIRPLSFGELVPIRGAVDLHPIATAVERGDMD